VDPAQTTRLLRAARLAMGGRADVRPYAGEGEDDWTFALVAESLNVESETPLLISTVDGGRPSVFCLKHPDALVVVMNPRQARAFEDFRRLFTGLYEGEGLRLVARRTLFRTVAQFALRPGSDEGAAAAFAEVLATVPPPANPSHDLVEIFRGSADIADCAYIISRFFALAHEVGHAVVSADKVSARFARGFSDELIEGALARGILALVKQAPRFQNASTYFIGPERLPLCDPAHIREEIGADLFALNVLINPTVAAMGRESSSPLDLRVFALEHARMSLASTYIARCRRIGLALAAGEVSPVADVELALQGIVDNIRLRMTQHQMTYTLARLWSREEEPPQANLDRMSEVLREIDAHLRAFLPAIEAAMADVMAFLAATFRSDPLDKYPDLFTEVFEHWSVDIPASNPLAGLGGANFGAVDEARDFLALAEEVGASGALLLQLRRIVDERTD